MLLSYETNSISGVMVSVLASRTVDRGYENRLGKTKDYKIDIYFFSGKHSAMRNKSKDWLVRNHDYVPSSNYPWTVVSVG